tara:strand:- start:51807 stop:53858 length:2052 start_codon:yes stop_codon:yes gene_type:complete
MKNLLLFLALISPFFSSAQIDTLRLKSKVQHVTVFFNGAEVERGVSHFVKAGKHIILLDSLPQEIDPQSIQATPQGRLKILSVQHRLSYPIGNNKSAQEKAIEASIDADLLKVDIIKNEIRSLSIEEKVLLENSDMSSKVKGITVEQLKAAGDFYRSKMKEIGEKRIRLKVQADEINAGIQKKYTEIGRLTMKSSQIYSQILVAVESFSSAREKIKVGYYVPTAGWQPYYDFRVQDVDQPTELVYNAKVFQTTGEDWTKTNLTLSSKNPALSNDKPELEPWHVDRKNHETQYKPMQNASESGIGSIKGVVLDASNGEVLPFVNIVLSQDGENIGGATTDFDGRYNIKPLKAGYYDLEVNFVGYNSKTMSSVRVKPHQITFVDFELISGVDLDAVEIVKYSVPIIDKDNTSSGSSMTIPGRSSRNIANTTSGVSIRGARTRGDFVYIDGVKVRGSENLPKSAIQDVATSLLSAIGDKEVKRSIESPQYSIDIPYTILSNGEDNTIKIKEEKLKVGYIYQSVPKLQDDVFLSAQVYDWNALNLLSGVANVYFKGTYTGTTFIDSEELSDTLSVSLSREKGIMVERKVNKELNDQRILGSNFKEDLVWDIEVKNNRANLVNVWIEDQYPISEKSSIEIELLETNGAEVDEKTGKLLWKLKLKPGESKKITYSYSIKYPKYQQLYGN